MTLRFWVQSICFKGQWQQCDDSEVGRVVYCDTLILYLQLNCTCPLIQPAEMKGYFDCSKTMFKFDVLSPREAVVFITNNISVLFRTEQSQSCLSIFLQIEFNLKVKTIKEKMQYYLNTNKFIISPWQVFGNCTLWCTGSDKPDTSGLR